MKYLIHRNWLASLCLLVMGLLPHYAVAQEANDLKAALTYNFSKFTQWPEETQAEESWKLCYIGDQYRVSFKRFNNKKIAEKVITIRQLDSLKNINTCHVVYISAANRKLLPRLFLALDKQPILTISDIRGFIDIGGMIEITPIDNHLKFKINLGKIEKSHLSISSRVLKLAIEVKR